MTYLQATASPSGPAAACLNLFEAGQFALFVSEETLRELREVLTRPRVRQKNPEITEERVTALLQRLASKATLLAEVPQQFSYPRDPKDEPYVNLALAAGARYLVSRDKDLLDLMNEDLPEGKAFRQRFPGLTILDPVVFLRELREQKPFSGGNPT
jgi:putative PIN family toxin of toxin-antitoxin system